MHGHMKLKFGNAVGFSSFYMNWFFSFLANRESAARIYWIVSFCGDFLWGLFSILVASLYLLGWNPPLINRTATISFLQRDKDSKTIT
jgi:hypothetical protein